jgi:type III restriction enzyme
MSKKIEFKFNHNYQYQLNAIKSIVDIFEGQEKKKSLFTVKSQAEQMSIEDMNSNEQLGYGVANKLDLLDDEILENTNKIKLRNGLPKSNSLHDMNFSIEMETGTGKTYVYLRTLFELNKLYGFKKFIIVVPSLAIREGVKKSIEMLSKPLKRLYDNVNFNSFVYDSSKIDQVRKFATSNNIQIMIINIQAFRRNFRAPSKRSKSNIFHREIDKLNGKKPQELIAQTKPVVIIDEPQSVDNTSKSKKAIASLNPLFTLRYSATHKEVYNLMYRLDPVDAYEKKLVKKIVVDSIRSEDNFNKPYIRLISVSDKGGYSAKIEVDVQTSSGKVSRRKVKVTTGEDLYGVTGEREQYKGGYIVTNIECYEGNEHIEFINGEVITLEGTIGDIDEDILKRAQIRKTIDSHLERERELFSKGIKVLSLFFVDKVSYYRSYDEDGFPQPGKYQKMFKEEYKKAINNLQLRLGEENSGYREYIYEKDVDDLHNGYFACDRKKDAKGDYRLKDSKTGSAKYDEPVYDLIMKDKEELLNFDKDLRFIFSHSALKEGWDNPNVFQICTLINSGNEFTKRQKIGRGLRLAVDQNGDRTKGHETNILTVIANESYEDFAATLQKEISDETGVKFGIIEEHSFANIIEKKENQEEAEEVGYETSKKIFDYLKSKDYINKKGKVQEKLKRDLKEENFEIPEEFNDIKEDIINVIKNSTRKLEVSKKEDEVKVKINKRIYLDPEFEKLWDKIKYKTTYSVNIDIEKLIDNCSRAIKTMPPVPKIKLVSRKVDVDVNKSGVQTENERISYLKHGAKDFNIPDVLRYIQEYTSLTRKTIADILNEADVYDQFIKNPQKFMEKVVEIINSHKKRLLVDGIKYERIGDEQYCKQELFEVEELKGYLNSNLINSTKSPYTQVFYDSKIEKEFAEKMEYDPEVKIYAKLPDKFIIDTPFGGYNPDWVILMNINGKEKLYFVVETKGNLDINQLRFSEDGKIKCGEKHFKALKTSVDYRKASYYDEFKKNIL